MYGNFDKLNKELIKKINNYKYNNHIIINEEDFSQEELKMAYKELECFNFAESCDFLSYEACLEDCFSGDKER